MKSKIYLLILLPLLSMASTVGGKVWLDANQDWEQTEESALYGIVVDLFDTNNKLLDSTKTDKNGNYQFKNIEDKTYTIKVIEDDYKSTTPNKIEFWDEKDLTNLNFGLYQAAAYSASGTVWNDKDENWEQDSSEENLANITIELYDETSKKIATTKTDANGNYQFKKIEDKLYTVKVVDSRYESTTPSILEFWDDKNFINLNFGLFTKSVIPPSTNEPITRVELETMIKNGEDVTKVNTSKITNMSKLFYKNSTFNQDISAWDTSNVTNMNEMFAYAYRFNQPIGSWNVSKVRNMSQMFRGVYISYVQRLSSTDFNQDLSTWNVSSVQTMHKMFYGSNINQDLTKWNVSNVSSWKGIFEKISVRGKPWIKMDEDNKPRKFLDDAQSEKIGKKEDFYGNYSKPPVDLSKPLTRERLLEMIANQQDVTKVNTSEITDMSRLFYNQTKFNQDISAWDTSKVTNMKEMFMYAYEFNQAIGNWDVSKVTNMSNMFRGYWYKGRYLRKITHKFNQDLSAWDVSSVTDMTKMFAISNFLQNISNWNVSNVTKWRNIFTQKLRGISHGNMKKELMPEKFFALPDQA